MWSPVTPALREEIRRFRLVFTCEECVHFVPGARAAHPSPETPEAEAGGACDLLYPTAPHRRATVEAKQDGDPLLFCKMFESG